MSTFSKNLKARRLECGMTQRELAAWIGRDLETLRSYEKGAIVPRLDTAIQVAAILGVELAALTGAAASE